MDGETFRFVKNGIVAACFILCAAEVWALDPSPPLTHATQLPAWRQSDASYEAAFRNQSTSPSYVMVTVIDANTGSAQLTCTDANFVLGAIHFERDIPFDLNGSERVLQMALENKSHRFVFHSAKALRNVSRHYTDAELAKVNLAVQAKSVSEIIQAQQHDPSLRRLVRGVPGYDAFQEVIACILIARGGSPKMADITGQLTF